MSIAEDLRGIADRAPRELIDVHDFFEHSKIAWRAVQVMAAADSWVAMNNQTTGTRIEPSGLASLATRYARDSLATLTFRQFVSIFEAFLFDFLHRLMLHNPWQFSNRQVDFATILRSESREELISSVVRKQLNELKYERLTEWVAAINRAVQLGCPTPDEIEHLSEIKASRDILEHATGVANETYLAKAGGKARYALGAALRIDDTYHLESWKRIRKAIADLTDAAVARLAK